MSRRKRLVLTLVGAMALTIAAALPAQAVVGAGVGTARANNGIWLATGACSAEIAATTNGSTFTYAVSGSALAEGPAAGTGISCHVYQGGQEIGGCSIFLPGPAAACADVVEANLSIGLLTVCAEPFAVFIDGSMTNPDRPCP